MTETEKVEFATLVEDNLMTVWYDGRYAGGKARWGAQEIGFMHGDEDMQDPFLLSDTAAYDTNPLLAVKRCLDKRPKASG